MLGGLKHMFFSFLSDDLAFFFPAKHLETPFQIGLELGE